MQLPVVRLAPNSPLRRVLPPSLARSVEKDRSVTHIKGRTIRECRPGLVVDLTGKYLLGINID